MRATACRPRIYCNNKERQVCKLSDKRNDAFSGYSSSGFKPKNITSDMWEPITTAGNYTAYTPPKQEFKSGQQTKRTSREEANTHRSGRVQGERKAAAPKPKREKDKPAGKTPPADRPISSGRVADSGKKKPTKKPKPKTKSKAKAPSKRSVNLAAKQREKTNKEFLRLVKGGKSTDEARVIITKRKIRKRKLKTFFSVMFLFFFALIFVLSYSYFEGAPVKNIVVSGDEVYTDSEILDAAKLSEGVNMLTVREKAVNESVIKILPFVSAIGVKYDLPDTLELNIISTTERFIIKNGGGYICVDKTGKVVSEKKKKLSDGQFMVKGMKEQTYTLGEMFVPDEANSQKFSVLKELASAVENNEIITCGVIDIEDINDITLTYKSRLRVYLGDSKNLSSKLKQAEDVLKSNGAEEKTGYVNVKYDIGAYFMQGSMDA